MSKFKTGDKVRYINTDHDTNPEYYPPYGTIGVFKGNNLVQWPSSATSGDGCWCCDESDIELVVDEKKTIDTHMSNEEIWEMLRPKMEKDGLSAYMFSIPTLENIEGDIKWVKEQTYKANDVHNAIALAYKVGYLRAMKGRPFKIGEKKVEEKKQGGHWEPVDINNLPKEGTKVRYSRECKGYSDSDEYICINDTGTVKLEGYWFGVELDNPHKYEWISFDVTPSCLDMWVEDDE